MIGARSLAAWLLAAGLIAAPLSPAAARPQLAVAVPPTIPSSPALASPSPAWLTCRQPRICSALSPATGPTSMADRSGVSFKASSIQPFTVSPASRVSTTAADKAA